LLEKNIRHPSDAQTGFWLSVLKNAKAALAPAEKAGDDPLDDLVGRFSAALLEKLKAARVKYGYDEGWRDGGWEADCQKHLLAHLAKGDPRDVAAYCAFMWHHGWKTVAATPTPPSGDVAERAYFALFEPAELDVIDNLEGALYDIKRLSEDGKPTDAVCIRTIERVQRQLIEAQKALQSAAHGGGTKSDGARSSSLPSGESEPLVTTASAPSDPAQETEAVAYRYRWKIDGEWTSWHFSDASQKHPSLNSLQEQPLFTRPVSLDREAVARIVYDAFPFEQRHGMAEKPAWVTNGNSLKQDEARKAARHILALIEGRT
jgi:hypothetical protein